MAALRDSASVPSPPGVFDPATWADPSLEPPTLARRFLALMLDWFLCVLVASMFSSPAREGWPPVVVLVAEYAFFVGLFGQTVGMALARLRCVSFTDGGRIGMLRGLLRGVLLCLVVPTLLMDGLRRGLHDRLAGSIVVSAPPRPR